VSIEYTGTYFKIRQRGNVNDMYEVIATGTNGNDGAWHHVCSVNASATSHTMYLDGAFVATDTSNVPFPVTHNGRIGDLAGQYGELDFYNGLVDDLRIYNRALSAAEVGELYSAPAPVTTTFVYDGDGNRVKKVEGGKTVHYVNKYYEKSVTDTVVTTYYYHGGRLVTLRKGTTVEYIHQEHLSGTAVSTDSLGAQVSSVKYLPFGETRVSTGTLGTDKRFTGQRLDGTGL
jgi:hypothetical protein